MLRGSTCLLSWPARSWQDTDYPLQALSKQSKVLDHPDRDAQFRYINDRPTDFIDDGQPVISVDTKKKELVGEYRTAAGSGGPRATRAGQRPRLRRPELGRKAIPYGVYDLAANAGWVSVGDDHDTAAFAVETIRRWWNQMGRAALPRRDAAADHRGRRRLQRLPGPGLEDRTRRRSPPRPGCGSPSATSRPAPPSGTRSSTGCSATSP